MPLSISPHATSAESQAAALLAVRLNTTVVPSVQPGAEFNLSIASHNWLPVPSAARSSAKENWIWLRLTPENTGELITTHGSFLFTALRLLESGLSASLRARLADGVLLPATFDFHRPLFDSCLTQYWRSVERFDDEAYVRTLAETGFTHCEVNGLQAHLPYEESVQAEFYPQFYSYCAGFNHFISTELTQDLWPEHYLEANLNRLKHLSHLAQKYGLKPGLLMFEPRNLPEKFFTKYPTLRGARVDHPFRSRLPRYCLAQDHPITKRHYAECMERLMDAVPELSYLNIWSNDSGAGFEHTASLYVGRNGGPYMIREWRNHEKIAATAGKSVVSYLDNLQTAAAKTNPDFDVILRLEPFKMEHDHIKAGLGGNLTFECPSMLVRGYSLPYQHPKYAENMGVAGSLFHTWMDDTEAPALAESQAAGVDPVFNYSGSGLMNHDPVMGLPFPRLIHTKMTALKEIGAHRTSCFGGLMHPAATPYWPNPVAIRAAQFLSDESIDDTLLNYATDLVGPAHGITLDAAWREFEEAIIWQPVMSLFCQAFTWQRTWDRPFVPDIEAIPKADRRYYEKHGCFQHNNPSLNDLGKDVLFDLVTREQGDKMGHDMDRELLPRVRALIEKLAATVTAVSSDETAQPVFQDLLDRVRAYLYWATALRNVCTWCATVHGYLESTDDTTRAAHLERLQAAIDLDLENTTALLELVETSSTQFMIKSAIGNNTFCYGQDFPDLLRLRLKLTAQYRHHAPRVNPAIMWDPVPGTTWPKGWLEEKNT
jgi:hypothetical protein